MTRFLLVSIGFGFVLAGCTGNLTVFHDNGDDDVGLDLDDDDAADDDATDDDDDDDVPADCLALEVEYDFEDGDGGFSHDDTDSGFSDPWELGEPDDRECYSGDRCWAIALDGEYGDCEAGALLTPEIDLSACAGTGATVSLTFWHWYQFEAGTMANYDGGTVQVSPDGGDSWDVAHPDPDYLGPIQGTYDECGDVATINGMPGWSAAMGGESWGQVTVELDDDVLTDAFRARFLFASDRGVVDEGWYVDDVEIEVD